MVRHFNPQVKTMIKFTIIFIDLEEGEGHYPGAKCKSRAK